MSAIRYEGIVQVVRRYKGKYRGVTTYHNSGSLYLFKLLAHLLCTGGSSANIMPERLDIGYYTEATTSRTWESLLQVPKSPSRCEEVIATDGTPTARYVWNVTFEDLKSHGDGESAIYMRACNKNYDMLMEVKLKTAKGDLTEYSIASGESHEIYWTMYFTNGTAEDTTTGPTTPDESTGGLPVDEIV